MQRVHLGPTFVHFPTTYIHFHNLTKVRDKRASAYCTHAQCTIVKQRSCVNALSFVLNKSFSDESTGFDLSEVRSG